MSPILKLMVLLGGGLLLGWIGYKLLSHRPFEAAPLLPMGNNDHQHPRGGETVSIAEAIQPLDPLPQPLTFEIERIQTPPLKQTLNILLVGLDTRSLDKAGRTDALVLVVLDKKSGHVGLVSIPRDLLVNISGHDAVRINTVYLRGLREGGSARGAELLKQTVRDMTGLEVAHLAFVDHAGFEELIDQMGGVAVRVSCPIRDRFIDPRGPDGHLDLDLTAGVHWMKGRTALMFARSRHGRGISDRSRRQQAVLMGIRDRLAQLGPGKVQQLLPQLKKTVYTEMRAMDLLALLPWLARAERSKIHGLVIKWKHVTATELPDGRWVMIPKAGAIHDALRRLFEAGAPGLRRAETCKPVNAAFEHRRRRDRQGKRPSR